MFSNTMRAKPMGILSSISRPVCLALIAIIFLFTAGCDKCPERPLAYHNGEFSDNCISVTKADNKSNHFISLKDPGKCNPGVVVRYGPDYLLHAPLAD